MSKTNYVNGSFLTPALMADYWGTNGSTGHTHDGADVDGSAPKIDLVNHTTNQIDLTTQVSGTLPWLQTDHFLRGYIDGLTITTSNSVAGEMTVTVSKGCCTSQDVTGVNGYFGRLPTSITKIFMHSYLMVGWSSGGGGGCAWSNGHVFQPGTWYQVFAIINHTTGAIDIAIGGQPDGSTILAQSAVISAGYTSIRRIGAIRSATASGTFKSFIQFGDYFYDNAVTGPTADYTHTYTNGTGGTAILVQTPVDSGITVQAIMQIDLAPHIPGINILSTYRADFAFVSQVTSQANKIPHVALRPSYTSLDPTPYAYGEVPVWVQTNTYVNLLYVIVDTGSTSGVDVNVFTKGWYDPRGRNL
jgi:hypothetical protein